MRDSISRENMKSKNIPEKLTIIFPAFNEDDVIVKTIEDAIKTLDRMTYRWEIIIVDNASTDNTGKIADDLAQKLEGVRVVHHPANLLYAMSTRTGYQQADGDIIFVIDSDGQYRANDIENFIEKIGDGYDIVYGWRRRRRDPLLRLFITYVLNLLARFLLESSLHDINCGFRAVKREVAKNIEIRHKVNAVGPEIWVRAKKKGYKVGEIPIAHLPRESGKSIHDFWRLPGAIAKFIRYLWALRNELRRSV